MKAFILGMILTMSAHALPTLKCESGDIRLTVVESSKGEIYVTYGLESALADGLLSAQEVDLIAKLPQSGEMTLVAKVGKNARENYLFFKGKRSTVTCK